MITEKFRYNWIGHIAFFALFLLAAVFYLERVIFVDSSYLAFRIIYDKDVYFGGMRYAALIPRVIPLMGVWMHLPLKAVLFLVSISYVLLYYLVYLTTAYGLKEKKLALAIPFVLLLGTQFSFYWCITETHQAIVYSLLLAAFLFYSTRMKPGKKSFFLKFIIASFIILLCYFSHPVAFFTVLFVLGYFMIVQKLWKDPYVYLLIALLSALMIIIVFFFSANTYDSHVYDNLFAFYRKLNEIFQSESLLFIIRNIFTIYFFSVLTFIATCLFYLRKKEFLKLAYYVFSIMLFLLVIFLTFDMEAFDFIQEKNINPLNVFLLIPFFYEVLSNEMRFKIPTTIFLILFLVFSIGLIISAYPFFANRLKYIKHLTDLTLKFPEKKFILGENDFDKKYLLMGWALGTESLLLTSLEGADSARTIYIPGNGDTIFVDINNPDIYISARWTPEISIKGMDKHLFNLGNLGYRKLSPEDIYAPKKVLYNNTFDKPEEKIENFEYDGMGNYYYIMESEFSPGYGEFFHKITTAGIIEIKASVKVRSFEDIDAGKFGLVISRMNGDKSFEYYHSSMPNSCFLQSDKWIDVSVSGMVRTLDSNDFVKVYLWNPEKIKVKIDDIKIDFMEVSEPYYLINRH